MKLRAPGPTAHRFALGIDETDDVVISARILTDREHRAVQTEITSALRAELRREATPEELSPRIIARALEAAGVVFESLTWVDPDGTERPATIADVTSPEAPAVCAQIAVRCYEAIRGGAAPLDARP